MHTSNTCKKFLSAWGKHALTLKGKKCPIGMSEVSYLDHVFSGMAMALDPKKIQAAQIGQHQQMLQKYSNSLAWHLNIARKY